MSPRTQIILAAGFGGIAANLLKIGLTLTGGPAPLPNAAYLISYTVGLAILATLGVGTALALRESSVRKAFFIGMGLPTFFQMSATNVSQIYSKPEASASATTEGGDISWLVGTAYADETRPARRRTSAVSAEKKIAFTGNKKPDRVIFYSEDGKMTQTMALDSKTKSIAVPKNAESFSLDYKGVKSEPVAVSELEEGSSNVEVNVKQKPWNGLFQAIGFENAHPYDVEVTQQQTAPPQ